MNPEPELILNVNDTEPNRYVTTRILSRAGFRVIEAATGAEALRLAGRERPRLVVLDVNLPDISGIEVCQRLKAQSDAASIMVLQMSATNIAVLDRVHSLAAGADSFLVEPVEPEELIAVVRALLRLHHSEAALRRSLAEREMLLKEVNHRVKNSLQLVMSMLSLQLNELKDAIAREHFTKAIARIAAIAAVHERLYQTDDPLSVEMRGYLTGLCNELACAGISDANECTLRPHIEPVRLPTDKGVSLALIVNELVINALKHGSRADKHVVIDVSLRGVTDGQLQLTVADNGAGTASTSKAESGLGTRLIKMLVQQLKGRIETANLDEGYSVVVTFPDA